MSLYNYYQRKGFKDIKISEMEKKEDEDIWTG